jgi:hypothetical protein
MGTAIPVVSMQQESEEKEEIVEMAGTILVDVVLTGNRWLLIDGHEQRAIQRYAFVKFLHYAMLRLVLYNFVDTN